MFGAGTVAPAARASDSATAGTSITESVAHLFDLVSLSLLIGICTLLAGALPAAVRSRITRFALVALPTVLVAGVLALANKSSQVPLWEALANTAWGHAMLARELAIVAVLVALALRRRQLALALVVPVAAAEAASGHAASLGALAILTMTAHILAGCLWVGGLIVLALVLPGLERRDVLETLARFGRLATAGVAVVVVTGLYGAGRQVASLDALLSTTYGGSLVAKLASVGVTGALGLLGSSPYAGCGRRWACSGPRLLRRSGCSSPRRSCSRVLPPAGRSSLLSHDRSWAPRWRADRPTTCSSTSRRRPIDPARTS